MEYLIVFKAAFGFTIVIYSSRHKNKIEKYV